MTMRLRLERVLERDSIFVPCASAVLALLLLALFEIGYRSVSSPPSLGVGWVGVPWLVVGLVAPFGVLLGLAQAGLWRLGRRYFRGEAWTTRPAEGTSVVRYVRGTQAAVAFLLLLAGCFAAAALLDRIQDDALRHYMLLYVVALSAAGGLAVALLAGRLLLQLWTRVEARRGLPWPRSLAVRVFAVCFFPCLGLNLLLNVYGDVLGVALVPTLLLALLLAQAPIALAILNVRPRGTVAAVVLAAAVSAPLVLDWHVPLSSMLGRQLVAGASLDALRGVTDVDRDGVSSTYGSGDCAPFDADVSPRQRDVPGNGEDENCDGRDAQSVEGSSKLYSDTLSAEQIRKYNVLWIVVDTMRVDRLSVYGAKRNTTPFLEELARSSMVFEAAYSQGTTTHLSIPSMLAGRDVLALTWDYRKSKTRAELDRSVPTLAELLSERGYDSHAVVGDHVFRFPSMIRGFERVVNARTKDGARGTNELALAFLEKRKAKKPFFLLAYYGDPHKPYSAPKNPFGKSDRDRYDAELLHVDRHIERLVSALRDKPDVWENTIVVLSSDHGEEFREHGRNGHGSNCHRETMQVPLILRVPGIDGRRIGHTVALVDIVPTLLELTGTKGPARELTGQSLLLTASGASDPDRWVTCVATKQGGSEGRAYYRASVRRADLFVQEERVSGGLEVFDTTTDPKEQQDLGADRARSADVQAGLDFMRSRETGNLWDLRLE